MGVAGSTDLLDQGWELLDNGEAEAASELADAALAAPLSDQDKAEGFVLRGQAALLLGDIASAREALADAAGLVADDPELLVDAGNLALALDAVGLGHRWFEEAVAIDSELADAHYGLGLVHQYSGAHAGQVESFERVRQLDEAEPPPPWSMTEDEFADLAEAALAELPTAALERLENVPVLIEPAPTAELVAEGIEPRLLGLFSGVPLPEKSSEGQQASLDSIQLFQRNLERACRNRAELATEIRITVLHETAHFFGLEDDDLDEIGLG